MHAVVTVVAGVVDMKDDVSAGFLKLGCEVTVEVEVSVKITSFFRK